MPDLSYVSPLADYVCARLVVRVAAGRSCLCPTRRTCRRWPIMFVPDSTVDEVWTRVACEGGFGGEREKD